MSGVSISGYEGGGLGGGGGWGATSRGYTCLSRHFFKLRMDSPIIILISPFLRT